MPLFRHLSAAWGLIVLTGSGCLGPKTQVDVAFRDPLLTKQTLIGKTVALAEVMSAPGMDYLPNMVQKELILKDLAKQLSESRLKMKVIGPEASYQGRVVALQKDAGWLKTGALKAPLNAVEKARLQASGCDYLMVLVLQTNRIDEGIHRHMEITTDVETDNEGKETSHTERTTYYTRATACRSIQAYYYLFDLKTDLQIWRARGSAERCSVASESSTSGYPDPPLFRQAPGEITVMEPISTAVIKKLP